MDPPPPPPPRGPHRHITTRSHHNNNHTNNNNNNRPSASFGGGREDCWSESATDTLIEAWGDRYIKVNRGNLRQKDWKEVADAVNSRQNGVKKTDVQCKNRIDTLKKKYKLEKAKPTPSTWPFYHRLDSLIGTNSNAAATAAAVNKKPTTVTFTIKSSSKPKQVESFDDDDDDDQAVVVKKEVVELSDGAASRELARTILKFGEIYERIERLKQQQMMELERERMEFTKDLEFQRLNMFVDTQLEIEKLNRQKYKDRSRSGKKL